MVTITDQPAAAHEPAELAKSHQVDADWPNRPDNVRWGQTPGVAVDAKDQVWVFTRGKPPIQVYDAGGKYLRGFGADVVGTAHYIRFDPAGNVWVADMGKHVVLQFTPEGKLLKTLGTPGEPGDDETHLNKPTDMAILPSGEVFVSDGYGNRRIVHFDKSGKFVKQWGKAGDGPGRFALPHAIAADSKGNLYVADRENARVQVFDTDGKLLSIWNNVITPWGIFVTAKDEIWICGSSVTGKITPPPDQVLIRFDATGKPQQTLTIPKGEDGKEKPGEVNWLHAVAIDSKGNIYTSDIRGKRAQKYVPKD